MKQGVRVVFEDIALDDLRDENSRKALTRTLEEHDLLCLLPCAVPGYALLLRKWGSLRLNLQDRY